MIFGHRDTVELKALVLGVIFATAIFAFKSGIGLGYFLQSGIEKASARISVLVYAVIYFLLFEAGYLIATKVPLFANLDLVQVLLRYAMVIHVVLAGGLFLWGLWVLRSNSKGWHTSYGWVALMLPCPVCLSVIFIITAILYSSFGAGSHTAVFGAYLVFLIMGLMGALFTGILQKKRGTEYSKALGITMVALASYFLLAVIIMPQFKDIDKIYRLAAYKVEREGGQSKQSVIPLMAMVAAWLSGFLGLRAKIKRARG